MFSVSEPGVVTMRKSLDKNETKVNSLKSGVIDPVELPPCVLVGCPGNASDISLVGAFVRLISQEITCPLSYELRVLSIDFFINCD